jgi:hypothetical protein
MPAGRGAKTATLIVGLFFRFASVADFARDHSLLFSDAST